MSETERREGPSRFPDVPLDRMQAIAAVCQMGNTEVLAGRQQVLHAAWKQSAEGNLKRQGGHVNVVVPTR